MYLSDRIRMSVPSDAGSAANEFAELFPATYLHFHVRRAKQSELSAQSRGVLSHLALSGPLTVSEAARHMNRAQSVMSEMLLALERKQWVMRFPDARDRRRTLVWLTEAGQERLAADRRVLDTERLSQALSAMTASERKQLLTGMRALLRSAGAMHAASNRTRKEK
ncbi:MAG TPA: MarR family transcriptional regulator [Polyangiaceae bacterium]|jgi:DNA-binding MarR family transcriptional regulator|nr:MarR family transcriptional regulator [Polyangiaceae bacterium]